MRLLLSMLLTASLAFAHDENPPPSETPDQDVMVQACYVLGARQAWGATARFNGAPQKMIVVPLQEMYGIFSLTVIGEAPPPAGIYVSEGFDEHELADYTEQAYYGWEMADRMWADKENPGYSVLLALFSNFCKENIPK